MMYFLQIFVYSAMSDKSNKYEPGEFGYWWTIIKGKKDIEGVDCKRGIDASCEGLTSLRGAPRSIDGNFYCSDNRLTSLEHCPKRVANKRHPGRFLTGSGFVDIQLWAVVSPGFDKNRFLCLDDILHVY